MYIVHLRRKKGGRREEGRERRGGEEERGRERTCMHKYCYWHEMAYRYLRMKERYTCRYIVSVLLLSFVSQVPAGLFIPSMFVGACMGRVVGIGMEQLA